MSLAFWSFAGFRPVSLWANICFLGTSRTEQVVYGKWAKKEANVISYVLMTSEWQPCFLKSIHFLKIFRCKLGDAVHKRGT